MSQDHDANANEQGWDGQSVYGPSTVIAALDQIEDLVESARSIPLSASIMVNKAEILDLLDQAREALPEDLVAADAVVADADAVLVRADSAAEQAIAEANTRASSTLEAANTKADQIVSAAREEAERTTSRADAEAEATLAQARADAEAALADAQAQADRLVSTENIVRMAEDRAREIVADARREEANLREGADDYVAQSLGELAGLISDLQRRTDAGRRTIAERRGVDVTDVELHD
ncbi:hypothetical protein [Pauljensenia hongkongensis]|uniref:ATPase n=1 Tax=Pauljensenia hongkongensis TaxID=178339 RepID=A0A1D8B0T3_9ACTO|nr:hypothetical protein [Pauljensenia hongkongensis]AOS46757.1 hypothetical protein BH719_01765 [Pauljensenia hongkongensis]ERH28747.1 hypothetical protein HMPREF1550_02058 [Actinomyces sp. oral taxon 877 str. F0543]RKV64244.1 MAG: hypothetical protein D8B55_07445 [Actinomyces sp.]WLD79272.1 hypothetical protein QU668_06885 [Schaalia sp. HMT-877]